MVWCCVSLGREECCNAQITSLHRIHHIRYLTTSAESFKFHAIRSGTNARYTDDILQGLSWFCLVLPEAGHICFSGAFYRQIVCTGNVSIDAEIAGKNATPLEKFWISSRVFRHNQKVEIWESISNKNLLCLEITWSSVAGCWLPVDGLPGLANTLKLMYSRP